MSRLLAAQVVSARAHRFDDVAIAHLGADQIDTQLLDDLFQPEVAHHGRHQTATLEELAVDQVARAQRHQHVAVQDLTALVDEEAAIGVAIECDADIGSQLANARGQLLRVE